MREMRTAYILIGKPEENRRLGRPRRRRWKDNIRMDLRKIRWKGVDWIHWLRIGTTCRLS